MSTSLLCLFLFLPVFFLPLYILSCPRHFLFFAIFNMPSSFPSQPAALPNSTAMPLFAFFYVLWFHYTLHLEPPEYFHSAVSILLCLLFFCCTWCSNCLCVSSFFSFHPLMGRGMSIWMRHAASSTPLSCLPSFFFYSISFFSLLCPGHDTKRHSCVGSDG